MVVGIAAELEGKAAIVTGAGQQDRGGAAVAHALAGP